MTRRIHLTAFCLLSTLMIAITVPMTAQAGTLTIYNQNCTKTYKGKIVKRITVHVFNGDTHCTRKKVTVHQHESVTVMLREVPTNYEDGHCGKYAHEAMGTAGGKHDVHADEDSSVTCKRDWAHVCQCTKD